MRHLVIAGVTRKRTCCGRNMRGLSRSFCALSVTCERCLRDCVPLLARELFRPRPDGPTEENR